MNRAQSNRRTAGNVFTPSVSQVSALWMSIVGLGNALLLLEVPREYVSPENLNVASLTFSTCGALAWVMTLRACRRGDRGRAATILISFIVTAGIGVGWGLGILAIVLGSLAALLVVIGGAAVIVESIERNGLLPTLVMLDYLTRDRDKERND